MTLTGRHGALGGAPANAAISVLGLSAQQVSGFAITLLAAGFLTAAEYGTYTLAIVFVECVVMLTYTGFFHFLVTSGADDRDVLPTMFWVMAGIGTLGGGLMIFCATPIAAFFDVPELVPILVLFGLMQPFASGISWGSAVLMRAGMMRQYYVILIVTNAFALIAGALVLILWQSLYALVLYRATRLVFSIFLFGRAVPTLPGWRFDTALFRQAARYASGLYGARSLSFLSMFGTDLILAYLFTTAESGLYRFANRLAMSTVDIIAQPLRSFALKSFGQAARADLALTPVFTTYLPGMIMLVGGVATSVFFLGEAATNALFKPEYLLALGAVQALSIRAFAQVGQHLIEPVFAATGRTRIAFWNNLIVAGAVLGATLAAAPLGFVQVAWAQAIVQCTCAPLAIWMIANGSAIKVREALRKSLRALILLTCHASAMWLIWQVLQPAELGDMVKLAFGIGSAIAIGVTLAVIAILDGILKPQLFAD